jgi:hypothetical protein
VHRLAGSVQRLVRELHLETPPGLVVAHACDLEDFADELLNRFGYRLADAMVGVSARRMALIPARCEGLAAGDPLRRAVLRRYREMTCTILDYESRRYITLSSLETAWRDFTLALCTLQRQASVHLLDAPVPLRRAIHQALVVVDAGIQWLADGRCPLGPGDPVRSSATVSNLHEELGVTADTTGYFLGHKGTVAGGTSTLCVVEGVQRLSLRQQTDLLRRLQGRMPVAVILGGDSTGRVHHRALDGWTLCCHAARTQGVAIPTVDPPSVVDSLTRAGGPAAGLCVWQAPFTPPTDSPTPWKPCLSLSDDGEKRWLVAPVGNAALVNWVCQTVDIPRGAMTVVNYGGTQALAPSTRTLLTDLSLSDASVPYLDQDIRCVRSLPSKHIRFGEVVRILHRAERTSVCVCAAKRDLVVVLSASDLHTAFRPARLDTLREQANSHYAARPVLVVRSPAPPSAGTPGWYHSTMRAGADYGTRCTPRSGWGRDAT